MLDTNKEARFLKAIAPLSPYLLTAITRCEPAPHAEQNNCYARRCDDHGVLGEIHGWLALPDQTSPPGRHQLADNVQLIDFSARFYRRYCGDLHSIEPHNLRWTRPDPPAYVWGYKDQLPMWLRLSAQPKPTDGLVATLDKPEAQELLCFAK
jgi:hypothetical protein